MYLGWATAGEVIWNYPKGRISMPLAKADLQGTIGLFQYISTFPFSYLKLFFIRIIVELSHYRSVYSFLHNTVSVLFLLVSYSTAFIGLISYRKICFARLVMLACFFHIGIIGITFAHCDGRFLMHFFPLLLPFVSAGFSNIMRSMLFKRNYSL